MLPAWGFVSAVWSAGLTDFFGQRDAQSNASDWTMFPDATPPANTLASLGGLHIAAANRMPLIAGSVTHSISTNEDPEEDGRHTPGVGLLIGIFGRLMTLGEVGWCYQLRRD